MFIRPALIALLLFSIPAAAQKSKEPAVKARAPLSFGTPKSKATTASFGADTQASQEKSASQRDKSYARGLFKKYDENQNRILEEVEWKKISGSPEKADRDGDKKITFDELLARVTQRRREKDAVQAAGQKTERRSYRLTTPSEKLPEDLPRWFTDKDANRDGQVAMAEYSRRWTDSTARRFIGFDKNDDGVITATEVVDQSR